MNNKELKPCPFCGGNNVLIRPFLNGKRWNLAHCCAKDDNGNLTIVIDVYGNSRDEVIKRWNRRVENER